MLFLHGFMNRYRVSQGNLSTQSYLFLLYYYEYLAKFYPRVPCPAGLGKYWFWNSFVLHSLGSFPIYVKLPTVLPRFSNVKCLTKNTVAHLYDLSPRRGLVCLTKRQENRHTPNTVLRVGHGWNEWLSKGQDKSRACANSSGANQAPSFLWLLHST